MDFLLGAGGMIVGVVITLIGVTWRLRGTLDSLKEELKESCDTKVEAGLAEHHEQEHAKDSKGRTIRERLLVLEEWKHHIMKRWDRATGRPR